MDISISASVEAVREAYALELERGWAPDAEMAAKARRGDLDYRFAQMSTVSRANLIARAFELQRGRVVGVAAFTGKFKASMLDGGRPDGWGDAA